MRTFQEFILESQNSREQQFYNDIRARAKKLGANDIDADVIASQAALETGWGKSPSGSWNYFGQKASSGERGTSKGTQEFSGGRMQSTSARFKDYGSLDDSIADRLSKWSYKTKGAADVADATRRLQLPGGAEIPGSKEKSHGAYATDPDYVSKISSISGRYGASGASSTAPSAASTSAPTPKPVLSKLKGVEGTGVGKDFVAKKWTDTEKTRYKAYGGK